MTNDSGASLGTWSKQEFSYKTTESIIGLYPFYPRWRISNSAPRDTPQECMRSVQGKYPEMTSEVLFSIAKHWSKPKCSSAMNRLQSYSLFTQWNYTVTKSVQTTATHKTQDLTPTPSSWQNTSRPSTLNKAWLHSFTVQE